MPGILATSYEEAYPELHKIEPIEGRVENRARVNNLLGKDLMLYFNLYNMEGRAALRLFQPIGISIFYYYIFVSELKHMQELGAARHLGGKAVEALNLLFETHYANYLNYLGLPAYKL